jgi:hypothetical protein
MEIVSQMSMYSTRCQISIKPEPSQQILEKY